MDTIADILRELKQQPDPLAPIKAKWSEVAGGLAEHTRVVGYNRDITKGVLEIECDSSAANAETHARKRQLLAAMQRGAGAVLVTDLRLRTGG